MMMHPCRLRPNSRTLWGRPSTSHPRFSPNSMTSAVMNGQRAFFFTSCCPEHFRSQAIPSRTYSKASRKISWHSRVVSGRLSVKKPGTCARDCSLKVLSSESRPERRLTTSGSRGCWRHHPHWRDMEYLIRKWYRGFWRTSKLWTSSNR